MKIKPLLFFFLISSMIYSQKDISENDAREKFKDENINKLINRYFLLFNTGQDNTSITSFAGIDIGKTEVTFSPTLFDKKNNVWNFKFSGGITEGASSLFKNNKFNTNISLEAKYNIRIKSKNIQYSFYVQDYNSFERSLINQRIANLESILKFIENNKVTLDSLNTVTKDVYKFKSDEINARIQSKINKAKSEIINYNTDKTADLLKSFTEQIFDTIRLVTNTHKKLYTAVLESEGELGKVYQKKYEEEFKKLRLTATHQKWVSVSGKVKNDAFKLLNRTNAYSEQVTNENYVSFGGSVLYNDYKYSQNDNSRFYSVGLSYEHKSNYLLLDDYDVTNTTLIGTNENNFRNINEKFTAYEGAYVKNINQFDIVADYYYFFNAKSIFGLHVYEKSSFSEVIKPNYDAGGGLVLTFKNKEKESVINAELYYTFKDIASNNSEINAFESNEVGLRFVLPLNFNFNL